MFPYIVYIIIIFRQSQNHIIGICCILESMEKFPSSVTQYRRRLVRNGAELYKDPPTLPPRAEVVSETDRRPRRRDGGGDGDGDDDRDGDGDKHDRDRDRGSYIFDDFPEFRPNLSPVEILAAGAFGGSYFRPITSSVTGITYDSDFVIETTLRRSWIREIRRSNRPIDSPTYDPTVNRYGVRCGGSLGMWESSGWITEIDPYGWFQWYCRFFAGRRSTDDARQVDRWAKCAGPQGRFRCQLCNLVLRQQTTADDVSVSPVIRQNLLHWGLELTPEHVKRHRRRTLTDTR